MNRAASAGGPSSPDEKATAEKGTTTVTNRPGRVRPSRRTARIAVDLGAASCRVSLLRWVDGVAEVAVVHRFVNAPIDHGESLRWDLERICAGVEHGLRLCSERCSQSGEEIASIGVDGWAVDYVRLKDDGRPFAPPFCYRDPRNQAAEAAVHARVGERRLYELTGLQRLAFNTIYQFYADKLAGVPGAMPWMNLPEYLLYRLGARRVSEYTNATHTGLIDLRTRGWSSEIFDRLGLDLAAAPELVPPGTDLGPLRGPLAALAAFKNTRLIAPACHDTASAVAAIDHQDGDWAYLSSGTWSLLGAVLAGPLNSEAAFRAGFTNLGAAGGGICFHESVNGMWLLEQCLKQWATVGFTPALSELVAQAEQAGAPDMLLEVDHPGLILPGNMPARINARRAEAGLAPIPESASGAPAMASLIFHSLAARYEQVMRELSEVTGKTFRTLHVAGGGARNALLNRLTAAATGLQVHAGHVESSTIGNLAIQMAVFEGGERPSVEQISRCARVLRAASFEPSPIGSV